MPTWIPWLILTVVLTGCATARSAAVTVPTPPTRTALPAPSTPRPPMARPDAFEQTGEASWYGRQHHGKRTASGETYDMHKLTAAHRTLPLGTRVQVTNLDNGRTVEVRINDRGPFASGRVLDLSYAAARRLGAVEDGVVPVGITIVSDSATGGAVARPPPKE